jgi:hypothetical protein
MAAADEVERLVAKRGSFHVARVVAYLWRGSDEWQEKQHKLVEELQRLENSPRELEAVFPEAFKLLVEVIKASPDHSADVDRALKAAALDKDIDKRVHT